MVLYEKGLEAVVSGFTACVLLVLLIYTIIKFSNSAKYSSIMRIFILTTISYLGYNVLKFYTSIATESMFTNASMCQCYWQSYSFYLIGKLLLYLFYCNRIYDSFKDSIYELKRRDYKILVVCVMAFYIGITIAFIVESAQWGNADLYPLPDTVGGRISEWQDCVFIDDHNILRPGFIAKIILLFVGEIIFAVVLLRLYVRRVLLVTNLTSQFTVEVSMNSVHSVSRSSAMNSNGADGADGADEADNSGIIGPLIEVAVKSTNLVIFSVVTSLIAASLFDALGRWLLELDTLVNFLCMFLTFSFPFSKTLYKIICYGFNKCCWLVFVQSCFKCFVKDCCQCNCVSKKARKAQQDANQLGSIQAANI